MKHILIFTEYFLPGYNAGGPVTSIANLSKLLDETYNITIVTNNKDLGSSEPYTNVKFDQRVQYEDFNVIYLSTIDTKKVWQTIIDQAPDVIYLNSFFSKFTQFTLSLLIQNKIKTPIILAPRGELQKNALAIKSFKKKIYLFIYKLLKIYKKISFHATDEIEHNQIKSMFGIKTIITLPNVPKISSKTPLSKNKNELKLIFISRIRDNKNLLFALNALSLCDKNITFDIYGPIEDKSYWDKCQNTIAKLPNHIKTEYKGIISPTNITHIMKQYHALLLPTKTENFGHVIVEAMQSGLIPIISDQTPWLNLEKYHAGYDLDLKDIESFTNAINTIYTMDDKVYKELSISTIEFINKKLNIDSLKPQYIQMFDSIINKKT